MQRATPTHALLLTVHLARMKESGELIFLNTTSVPMPLTHRRSAGAGATQGAGTERTSAAAQVACGIVHGDGVWPRARAQG